MHRHDRKRDCIWWGTLSLTQVLCTVGRPLMKPIRRRWGRIFCSNILRSANANDWPPDTKKKKAVSLAVFVFEGKSFNTDSTSSDFRHVTFIVQRRKTTICWSKVFLRVVNNRMKSFRNQPTRNEIKKNIGVFLKKVQPGNSSYK